MRPPPPFDLIPQQPPADSKAGDWPPPVPGLRGKSAKLIGRLADDSEAAWLATDWPRQLILLCEVAEAALRHQQAEGRIDADADPAALARAVVAAQADVLGGSRIRFPTAERVRQLLRDAQIWRAFDGRNVAALARRFRIPERSIYEILRRQRELRRRRRQQQT